MRDLLLNHNLTKPTAEDEVRQVARVQTLTTLQSLDADRNRIVLQFLQETHLIGIGDVVINLTDANLSNDYLSGADLSGVDLSNATLTGSHLDGADLSNATLYGANLNRADLKKANLTDTIFTGAFLGNTILKDATLTGARLNGSILTETKLNDAHLSGADLNGADLSSADLSGTDLSDADLRARSLTQPQLDTVSSCTHASLSAPLTCQHHGRVTLTYWYTESPAEAPVISKLIHQFEDKYPYINVIGTNTSFFQTQTEFVTKAQESEAPDVLRSDVGWVGQFASRGYLLNIDSYVSQDDLSDYNKAPLESAPLSYDYYKGHLYGLPQVSDFLALLYNKAELASAGVTLPPATMAEFKADAMKVSQSKPGTYGFETNGTGYNVLPFLWAFGGGMLGQHDKPLVNDAGSLAGLNFLLKLEHTGKVMPPSPDLGDDHVNMVTDFMSGKTAMIFDGPYHVSQILTGSSFKSHPGNLGIARIPTCSADTPTCQAGQTGSPLGGQSYVISAGTAHPYEAYKFISFMSSTASQVEIAKENHTLPTRRSAYRDNRVSSDPYISEFLRLTPTAVARPAIPQNGNLFDALDPNIANALDGIQSPLAALNKIADAWKQLLADS